LAWQFFFLGQSIGILETNTFQQKFFSTMKIVDADRQTDMARSTRLVILINNIYTLWGRKRFLLPVTYLPTNLVYPFTLRVTGIIIVF